MELQMRVLCVSRDEPGDWGLDRAGASPKDFGSVISLKQLLHKASTINRKTWIWIGLGLVAVPALHIYYIQEMLAALIVLTLLFLAVATGVLTTFFLVRTIKPIIASATPKIRRIVRKSVDAVEGVIASPVWTQGVPHRFRREQLKLNETYRMVCARFAGLKPNRMYGTALRARGAAVTMGLCTHKRILNRLGNWLTQKVSYSDLMHLASMSQVRPSIRGHRRAADDSRSQAKRNNSQAV
jgi:hypothetical protein